MCGGTVFIIDVKQYDIVTYHFAFAFLTSGLDTIAMFQSHGGTAQPQLLIGVRFVVTSSIATITAQTNYSVCQTINQRTLNVSLNQLMNIDRHGWHISRS